jgi:hypothetical protein
VVGACFILVALVNNCCYQIETVVCPLPLKSLCTMLKEGIVLPLKTVWSTRNLCWIQACHCLNKICQTGSLPVIFAVLFFRFGTDRTLYTISFAIGVAGVVLSTVCWAQIMVPKVGFTIFLTIAYIAATIMFFLLAFSFNYVMYAVVIFVGYFFFSGTSPAMRTVFSRQAGLEDQGLVMAGYSIMDTLMVLIATSAFLGMLSAVVTPIEQEYRDKNNGSEISGTDEASSPAHLIVALPFFIMSALALVATGFACVLRKKEKARTIRLLSYGADEEFVKEHLPEPSTLDL